MSQRGVEAGGAASPAGRGSSNGPRQRGSRRREQTRGWVRSRKPNGLGKGPVGGRRGRPGTLTLEWRIREGPLLQERERPSRAPDAKTEHATARQEALIQVVGKTPRGERRGEAHGVPDCDAQSRACRRWAKLGASPEGENSLPEETPSKQEKSGEN
jgi:hypothetical protein